MTQITIDADISKDTLDVYRLPDGERRQFGNDKARPKALIAFIGKEPARIVFEPTGPYHRAFETALSKRGSALIKVNPRQARRFAQAAGKLAKTDRSMPRTSPGWEPFSNSKPVSLSRKI